MKRNLIKLLHLQKYNKGTSNSVSEIYQNSKKTESLAQLRFSLHNRREEKEAQLQAQQLKEAEEIQNYQELEELAQNFDFLLLENFLTSNDQTHTITLATYKTFNFRQKILFGFKTKAFIYTDLLNFILIFLKGFGQLYLLVSFYLNICFIPLGIIFIILSIFYPDFSEYLSTFENSSLFNIFKINIPIFFLLYMVNNLAYPANANIHDILKLDDYVLPLEIKLYDSKKIKLPEFRLLFKELQAMKLQPKLQITICEDYTVDLININIADLDSGKISASILNDLERAKKLIKIEIEIDKNKFIN